MKSAACHWGTCACWISLEEGAGGKRRVPSSRRAESRAGGAEPLNMRNPTQTADSALKPMVGSTIVCTAFGCGLLIFFK